MPGSSSSSVPLLLLPGDPLPRIEGLQAVGDRPRWLLLVVAPAESAEAVAQALGGDIAARAGSLVELAVLAFGGETTTNDVLADADGHGARRLGALPAVGGLQPVAVLVEPRGSVHVACGGDDFLAAARAALAAMPA